MTPPRFEGRHALITGAASGIGLAAARRLASEGARVLLVDRDTDGLAAVRDQFAESACVTCDQSRSDDLARLEEHVREDPVDVCFANAGYGGGGAFLATDLRVLRRHLDVNVFGTASIVQLAARSMVDTGHGGAIVVTGSTASLQPTALLSHYSIAKAAVLMLVRATSEELGPHGIRINAVLPGITRTGMTGHTLKDTRAIGWSEAETPLGRIADPEDIADAVAFLASRQAAFITGTSLLVDGGSTVHGFPRWYARDSRDASRPWASYHEHVTAVLGRLEE